MKFDLLYILKESGDKSQRSDWFFLDRDSALRTASSETIISRPFLFTRPAHLIFASKTVKFIMENTFILRKTKWFDFRKKQTIIRANFSLSAGSAVLCAIKQWAAKLGKEHDLFPSTCDFFAHRLANTKPWSAYKTGSQPHRLMCSCIWNNHKRNPGGHRWLYKQTVICRQNWFVFYKEADYHSRGEVFIHLKIWLKLWWDLRNKRFYG